MITITHTLTNQSYSITLTGSTAKIDRVVTINLKNNKITWAAGAGAALRVTYFIGALQIAQAIVEIMEQGGTLDADSIEVALIGQLSD